jgi:hypothetical protein
LAEGNFLFSIAVCVSDICLPFNRVNQTYAPPPYIPLNNMIRVTIIIAPLHIRPKHTENT